MKNPHKIAGFSLIELMAAVLIVAILAAIAVPAYQSSVRKARRTDARAALLDLAGREERYYNTAPSSGYTSLAANLGYAASSSSVDMASSAVPIVNGSNSYYQVTITNVSGPSASTAGTYTITATPITGTAQAKDTDCAIFTLNQSGLQGASNAASADTSATCWK